MWFKTTTGARGKLIGLENTSGTVSSSWDRTVVMRPDGRVVYVGGKNVNPRTLTTPLAYNDGAWHHLVLTATPSQNQKQASTLYLDGIAVAASNTWEGASYSGWWRIGYGQVPTGTGYPATGNFTGSIDNVAIYPTALSAARVGAHHATR